MKPLENTLMQDFMDAHPDPADAVAHTLSVFADTPDSKFIVTASSNVYGEKVVTGLTWGDLRRLAAAAKTDTCA